MGLTAELFHLIKDDGGTHGMRVSACLTWQGIRRSLPNGQVRNHAGICPSTGRLQFQPCNDVRVLVHFMSESRVLVSFLNEPPMMPIGQ